MEGGEGEGEEGRERERRGGEQRGERTGGREGGEKRGEKGEKGGEGLILLCVTHLRCPLEWVVLSYSSARGSQALVLTLSLLLHPQEWLV